MSHKGNGHFNKKDIQTHLKHILLEDYLKNWSQVLANASKGRKITEVNFVDGFAGRGYFDDGKMGSPQIAIHRLLHFQNLLQEEYGNALKFNIFNVENDQDYFHELEKIKFSSPLSSQIHNLHGKFEDHLDDLIYRTKGKPTLYFIDPFGYKGVLMNDMRKILSHPSNELLINVMSYSLVRNITIKSNEKELCKFFGVNYLPPNIPEYLNLQNQSDDTLPTPHLEKLLKLEDSIIEFYKNEIKSGNAATYALSKRIHSQINNNVYFHLVFVTRNRRGLIEMKKSMVQFEEKRKQAEDVYILQNQLNTDFFICDLFSDDNQLISYEYKDYVKDFMKHFNRKSNITYAQLIDFFLQHTPLPFESLKDEKSIYNFSKKLLSNTTWIRTTNKQFKDFRKEAEGNIINSFLPESFPDQLDNKHEVEEQMWLF
ncbi:three-Cys-motif partner protein TcmP [Paenibacillus sanfengchensis]|uniref:three-Cys-motif partner protein TcmP n=1 Tax=Paenibacillus sanfengchensis TaxID=3119819 RepID=UPI002FDFB7B3